jgi:hypothetical protein
MRAQRDCSRYSGGATPDSAGSIFSHVVFPALVCSAFVRVGQGVVTVAVGSPPPVGSMLCSKGILELDMDSHPYFSYMFVLSKLVVPIVGPRQYNLSSSSSSSNVIRIGSAAHHSEYPSFKCNQTAYTVAVSFLGLRAAPKI